jgi:methyl-accepting chemotaxis protein
MTLILSVVAAAVLTLFVLLFLTATKISRQVGTITNGISKAGSVVTGSIDQLTSAGSTLAQHSTAAAASLEETVASLEEMTSMVQLNSDNAKQASALSQASRDAAEQGEKEIHSLITSMNDISASSKKIEEIINVIDDIAFQTNLLALNAAVEAARAGEQGKGFAVVAEAVRSLAQRSAAAAKDITGLIKDSVQKIDHGTQTADRSGAVLNNIVTSVKKVADLNNEIATASSEQTTGISQISKAMNQLDQTSQNNAASSEEIASSAQNISQETIKMMSSLENLKHMILGGGDFHEEEAAPVKKSASTASSGEGFWSSLFGSKKPA